MALFRHKEHPMTAVTTQIRRSDSLPFAPWDGRTAISGAEVQLYRAVRQAVPVVDAAINKIIRLAGGLLIRCEDSAAQEIMDAFLRLVPIGRGQVGLNAFLDSYLDSMLTFGQGVGEIILTPDRGDIAAVLCGRVEDIAIREGENPMDFAICSNDLEPKPLPSQDLLLFTPHNPESGSPYGVSMLRGMPFLTELLGKIYTAMGANWERMGNVRFAVVYKPQGGELDASLAQERSAQIAREWSRAMQSGRDGNIRDFVAIGDVEIKVIGADNQVLDSEVPVRQIMEQLVAKTGIPPFMLGLSWSSTERMSSQQADILTSELTAIRRSLTPVVERICRLWLRLHGFYSGFVVDWTDINLQDELDEAKAAWYRAQTRKLELENAQMEQSETEGESL